MKNKKYIFGIIFLIIIAIITIFTISINAENTGGTAEQRENEETLVRMAASLSMGSDANNQVNMSTLVENLNKYSSASTTVAQTSSEVLTVTFVSTGNVYEVNVDTGLMGDSEGGSSGESGGGTTSSGTYLPTGFTEVSAASATTGLTIKDGAGNQYVWVEVPQTTTVYPTAGLSLDLDNLTGTALTDAYTAIENDLHTYTSIYRNGTSYTDTWYSEAATGLTETAYYELKNKMLKSVYQNGGFYVGKYEAGTTTARSSSSDELTTPVIQANAYPYSYVTNSQAQSLASGMASGEYTSSLMFGVQWDLMLKYLETKGVSQSLLNDDSTSWGNYYNNTYDIENESVKYNIRDPDTYLLTEWLPGTTYKKESEGATLLTTGANSSFSKMGIYDIAGNVSEWTLEYTYNSSYPCARRGGSYLSNGSNYPASFRYYYGTTVSGDYFGFRPSLF